MNYHDLKNKRVFVTGHTGFKGVWLCHILLEFGATVIGYAKEESDFFQQTKLKEKITSILGDIQDYQYLQDSLQKAEPDIVLHLAAQPLVLESYKNPVETYGTNVMGTVHLCEAIRHTPSVKSFVNVTTDKVYENKEWDWGYREQERLNGHDPYSNSKSCSELVTSAFIKSFFQEKKVAVSTVRAGNVIGGGDFSEDRIIPDCVRSAKKQERIEIRNPNSIRPYQFVLEPLAAYLWVAMAQMKELEHADCYNIGPKEEDCVTTLALVQLFCESWGENTGYHCKNAPDTSYHEANFLKLDSSKIKNKLKFQTQYDIKTAVEKTVLCYQAQEEQLVTVMEEQIRAYFSFYAT